MEKPDFQALSAELPDCPIGEIEMQLDEMLENFKQGEPNAAKWYVFVDKVKRNCLKLSLSEERQAVIVEWAKYARFDLNKQISGTLKGTITEDGSLVLEEPPRVVSETWKRISARASAPFPSLEALNNESTPTTSSVPTSKNVVARAEAAILPTDNDKLTHKRLVLLCLYQGQTISNLNCERVAKALKSNAPGAAAVLLRKWKEWGSSQTVRSAIGKRTVAPLIEDMQWVITQLTDEQKKVADNDLRYIMREIN